MCPPHTSLVFLINALLSLWIHTCGSIMAPQATVDLTYSATDLLQLNSTSHRLPTEAYKLCTSLCIARQHLAATFQLCCRHRSPDRRPDNVEMGALIPATLSPCLRSPRHSVLKTFRFTRLPASPENRLALAVELMGTTSVIWSA